MDQEFDQFEYERPRTRRRSKTHDFHDFSDSEKKSTADDTIFRCTVARSVMVVGLIIMAMMIRSDQSPGAVWVRSSYHRLLQTPMNQSVTVWREVIEQSGVQEVFWQLEEAVLVYAGAEQSAQSTDATLPSSSSDTAVAQSENSLPLGFIAGAMSSLSAVSDTQGLTGQGGWWPWGDDEEETPENAPRPTPSGTTALQPMLSSRATHPVTGVLTSEFGFRVHPISEQEDFHTGIDIAAPMGAPILAIYPGVVAEVGTSAIYGNYINIDHGGGVMTTYSHCIEILAEEGANIRAGERIAIVGSTGISTGPHLHLELKVQQMSADPLCAFDLV